MAAGGSTKVVVLALLANAGIAVAKLIGALVTHSGSMMAEAVHSFADAGNQGLLLLGHYRSAQPADSKHPLGYARESYFWALLVAATLFVLGGAFSLYEGVHKLGSHTPIQNGGWAIGILLLGCILEGMSLRAAWNAVEGVRGKRSVLRWARATGNVNLLVVYFEDLAAMLGLAIALIAVTISLITGDPFYDAIGSCVIGGLLLFVALFIGSQVRRLIIGLSAGAEITEGIRSIWVNRGYEVLGLYAIWDGPERVLVTAKVRPPDPTLDTASLMRRLNEMENEVRAAFPQVAYHFVEPDFLV